MRDINKYAGLLIDKNLDRDINELVIEMINNDTVTIKKSQKSIWVYRPWEKLSNDRRVLVLGSVSTKDKEFIRVPINKVRDIISGVKYGKHYNTKLKKWAVK